MFLRQSVADHLLQPLHQAVPVLQADDAVHGTEGIVQAATEACWRGDEGHVVEVAVGGDGRSHGADGGGH